MAVLPSRESLVWIDCEMTGLNADTDSILSIFCFVTDWDLNLLERNGWGTVIHHGIEKLNAMDDWCTKTHAATGLTAAVLESKVSANEAAATLLKYIQSHVPEPRKALLAGNSVHADKAFLSKEPFDKVLNHLHYRIFDISSIKEAARRWAPGDILSEIPAKRGLHKAKEDIIESIEEARFYKKTFFQV